MNRLQFFWITLGSTLLGKVLDWVAKPIVSRNIEDALEKREGHTLLSRWLASFQQLRESDMYDGFWIGAFAILGIWGIAELTTYLRRRKERSSVSGEEFVAIGWTALTVADEISNYLGDKDSIISVHKCFSEVLSVLLRLQAVWIDIPSPSPDFNDNERLKLFATYLYKIGPLLRDGHTDQARQYAVTEVININSIEPPRRRLPRSIAKGKQR
jgi:hypothetical protein